MSHPLTIRRFLREIRFFYLLATSVLIIGLVFGIFEIVEITLLDRQDLQSIRYLHFSRGATTALSLLVWVIWTLYEFRRRYLATIQHQGDQYKRILDNASEAFIITDKNHLVTYWNPAATDMLGWSPEEVTGSNIEKILKIPVASRFAKHGQQEIELDVMTRDRQRKFVALTMNILPDEKGQPEVYSYMFRDLTMHAIRQAQMERSERMASLGHMAAGVAHEIGNPLTAISSIIQLLQRKTTDETQLEQLGRVRENINRITRIVRELVDFSRPKSPEISSMNLNDTIHDAIGLLKHDVRCKNVKFETELDPELPMIRAVPDQFHQVMLNFILNAVDATEKTALPVVRVTTTTEGGVVIVTINDNGSGIPQNLQNRIFEPFFTTKEVGRGTGLGLSVSHNIISSLGGEIHVDSHAGDTTFTIRIPVSK